MKQNKSTPGKGKHRHSTNSSKDFKVMTTDLFIKEAKRLKKKYPNIGSDFRDLSTTLKKDPITGNDALGCDCYKVRMPISDKGCGESGGARVIIEVKIIDSSVYLLSVYDKAEKENFDGTVKDLLKKKLLTR
ncbi:hypothetical protein AAHN97_14925 [Chitinophaga niabensis]|uniref:hypothetical protein n=1 Tax=Chitinophaga niabensis TaxID=536979 RepID=UPI0031B9C2C8